MGVRTHSRDYCRRLTLVVSLFGFALSLSACQPKRDGQASYESPIVTSAENRTPKVVLEEIRFLTQDLTCSSDADCVLQPLGTDGCGTGDRPYTYLSYSAPRTNGLLLQEKIREFNLLQLRELEVLGPPASCLTMNLEPTISCLRETSTCSDDSRGRDR